MITDYVPYHVNGSILVTSRDPFAKEQFFSNGFGIDLEPLPQKDSVALLRKLIALPEETQTSNERDASVEPAGHLNGLPLAMTQIAGFIRRRHISIREFVNTYATDERYADIHDISNPSQEQRYGYTLAPAYNFQALTPRAMKLVQSLAFMNADRIQDIIFHDSEGSTVYDKPGWTASESGAARYELLTSSIIKRNIYKKELWIYRMIQAEVRTQIQTKNCYQTFVEAVSFLGRYWPPGDHYSQKITRWSLCEDLLPHHERFPSSISRILPPGTFMK